MQNVKSVVSTRLSDLSPEFQAVILKMRDLHFGVILDLPIANGRPQLKKAKVTRRVKLATSKPVFTALSNFQLCQQHLDFVALVESIQQGTIQRIEVQYGLPCHIDVQE